MKIIRTILLIINILLAIGLLLTTIAPYVAPSRSVLPSMMAFGFRPMLAANVLMVILWLIMGKWQFLISVATIALRWGFVGLFLQVGGTSALPDRSEHPQMVTVMSYNTHMFQGREIHAKTSDSIANGFMELVREYSPDILCLQEYDASSASRLTDSLTLLGYNHYYGAHRTGKGIPYGTTVYSRLPITYVNKIDNSKVLVELMLDDRRFRLCCIHMDSYQLDDADREGIENLLHGKMEGINDSTLHNSRTLGKVKETLLQHETEWQEKLKPLVTESTVPMLLAGDFNDIPSSWLYSQVSKHLDDTFCDEGFGMCNTYNGGFPEFRIDMVFHSNEFHTLSYKRIKSDISDHYPVITSLELTQ